MYFKSLPTSYVFGSQVWDFRCCLLSGAELTAQLAAEAAAVVATRLLSLEHWKVLEAQDRTGTKLM